MLGQSVYGAFGRQHQVPRKAPRIISRKRLPRPSTSELEQHDDAPVKSKSYLDEDIDEGVIVRGGVMLRVYQDADQADSSAFSLVNGAAKVNPHHITVDMPPLPSDEAPYVQNPLPGVANQVESYPCQFCPDRIFLTAFGLEQHTRTAHEEYIEKVLEDIAKIHDEWQRRECGRDRQRKLLAQTKMQQNAITAAVLCDTTSRPAKLLQDLVSTDSLHNEDGEKIFEPCRTCGILINTNHASAMMNHIRAHTKNDELRAYLLAEYGQQFVVSVTCHECQLVFSDEAKLNGHMEISHFRKKKYVCKWCGFVCLSMTDLNTHKSDVHAVSSIRSKEDIRRRQMAYLNAEIKQSLVPTNPPLGIIRKSLSLGQCDTTSGSSSKVMPLLDATPCRTTCELCGLIMVKPSLLIRHMLRVHNQNCFTAIIETKGMPDIRVDVDKGRVIWWCCETAFIDRYQFLYHRRASHQPKYTLATRDADGIIRGLQPPTDNTNAEESHLMSGDVVQITESQEVNSSEAENVLLLVVADEEMEKMINKSGALWNQQSINEQHPDGLQHITLSAEQYEQLRSQTNGDLSNMQVILIEEQAPPSNNSLAMADLNTGSFVPLDSLGNDSDVPEAVQIEDIS